MQTMGVLNDDVDSEDYMESDEILDVHTINRITLEEDQHNNIQDECQEDITDVRINSLVKELCRHDKNPGEVLNEESGHDGNLIHILSSKDKEINRFSYDADIYHGDNDGALVHLKDVEHLAQDWSDLSVEYIT